MQVQSKCGSKQIENANSHDDKVFFTNVSKSKTYHQSLLLEPLSKGMLVQGHKLPSQVTPQDSRQTFPTRNQVSLLASPAASCRSLLGRAFGNSPCASPPTHNSVPSAQSLLEGPARVSYHITLLYAACKHQYKDGVSGIVPEIHNETIHGGR